MAKGTITTEFTIWCNRCSHWEQEANVRGKAEMIRIKRAGGWKYKHDLKWYCPNCANKKPEGKEPPHVR